MENFAMSRRSNSQKQVNLNGEVNITPVVPRPVPGFDQSNPPPLSRRPTRLAKEKCDRLMSVMIHSELNHLQDGASSRITNESNEQHEQRLKNQRQRSSRRIINQTNEQTKQRLDYLGTRYCYCIHHFIKNASSLIIILSSKWIKALFISLQEKRMVNIL